MKEIAGSYRRIVIDFEAEDGLMRPLDFSENMTKAENEEAYRRQHLDIRRDQEK